MRDEIILPSEGCERDKVTVRGPGPPLKWCGFGGAENKKARRFIRIRAIIESECERDGA